MVSIELAKRIDETRVAINEAQIEFNEATGLYVDAYTYKLKYLEALHTALMTDFKQEVANDNLRRERLQDQEALSGSSSIGA